MILIDVNMLTLALPITSIPQADHPIPHLRISIKISITGCMLTPTVTPTCAHRCEPVRTTLGAQARNYAPDERARTATIAAQRLCKP